MVMEETARDLLARFIGFIRKNKGLLNKPITVEESYSFDPSFDLQTSISEIIAATKKHSIDLILGEGTLGLVYKVQLSTGLKLAIKKFSINGFQAFMEFRSELESLGKIRHRNIVRILGYCVYGLERILIYEFFDEGSLDRRLHYNLRPRSRSRSRSWSPLSWERRIKIIKGVANGLAYMHDLEKPIIHRNIKASNILLDSNFDAHIADFGFARMIERHHTHVTTQPAVGAPYYMPPEYEDGCTVATTSGDVYSFGVLMLEVATGKRPTAPMYFTKEISFMQGVRTMVGKNQEMKILDQNISTSDTACVRKYFRIAIMCTNVNRSDRPAMRDVVEFLTKN